MKKGMGKVFCWPITRPSPRFVSGLEVSCLHTTITGAYFSQEGSVLNLWFSSKSLQSIIFRQSNSHDSYTAGTLTTGSRAHSVDSRLGSIIAGFSGGKMY